MPSSVLLYNTQWQNSSGSLVSSQASLRQSCRQSPSSSNNRNPSAESNGAHGASQTSLSKHKRQSSRPFDFLYQSDPSSQKSPVSKQFNSNFENYKTASYIKIEEAIRSGKTVQDKSLSPVSPHPVVTRVESPPRRTGSLMSDSPTLRRRRTIRKRNKMQKRNASPEKEASPSSVFSGHSTDRKVREKKSKLSFVFPIKRRTSYKYFPVSRAYPKESKFNSQRDIDEYFARNNILSLMKDVIPRTMAAFEYKHLTNVVPELESHPRKFAISRDARFTMLDRQPSFATMDKVPLQGEKLVENQARPTYGTHYHDSASSENSLLAKRRTFLTTVRAKYREVALSEGGRIPQKIEEAFPFEGDMMTEEEKEKMNTSMLLEILLRRTVAAKIEFRIKRSGVSLRPKVPEKRQSSGSTSTKSSDTSSSFGTSGKRQRHSTRKRHPDHKFDFSDQNTSSINTDELMQHNASLLSELLPSPQISFTSNILGMEVSPTNTQNAFLRSVSNNSVHYTEAVIPELNLDKQRLQDWEFDGRGSSYDPRKDTYIYDISKLDLASKKKRRPISTHLGNVNNTSLRPLKGSNHTISSYSVHSAENFALHDTTPTTSAYGPQKRSSNSTGETTRYTENNSLRKISDYDETPITQIVPSISLQAMQV